eukprot:scaffold207777_cov77-Attheya_sp.AAC.2
MKGAGIPYLGGGRGEPVQYVKVPNEMGVMVPQSSLNSSKICRGAFDNRAAHLIGPDANNGVSLGNGVDTGSELIEHCTSKVQALWCKESIRLSLQISKINAFALLEIGPLRNLTSNTRTKLSYLAAVGPRDVSY